MRWQIELLFKLRKSQGQLAVSRSEQPWRQLCEIYAKLLGLLIQHGLWPLGCWERPDRSLVQAEQIVQHFALGLALASRTQPEQRLNVLQRCLATVGRLNKRRQGPSTVEGLLAPEALA